MTLILMGFVTCLSLLQLVLVLLGIYIQRRQSRFRPKTAPLQEGISVVLPIKGLDPGAQEHFRALLTQDVGAPVEVIFSLQDPADPAMPVLQELLTEVDRTPARILVNPVRDGLNGKASNLLHGVAAARYRNLVMADADIVPGSDLLARLVPPLLDKRVGQVTALPVVKGARNLADGLMALTWNMGLTSAWAPQAFLGVARTGPGACFAIRRDVLDRIGGYVSEDMAMCRRIREAGPGLALVRALWSDRVSWRGVAYRIRATVAGTSRSTQPASPSGRSHEQVCPISPDCAAARRKKRTDVPVLVGFRPEITSCGGTLSAFFCHRGRQLKKADR